MITSVWMEYEHVCPVTYEKKSIKIYHEVLDGWYYERPIKTCVHCGAEPYIKDGGTVEK